MFKISLQIQAVWEEKIVPLLSDKKAKSEPLSKIEINEERFRWFMNEDAMATEKLSDGIRKFTSDIIKLDEMLVNSLRLL